MSTEELKKLSKDQLLAEFAKMQANTGVAVERVVANSAVQYDESKHIVVGVCDSDCIAQLLAIGKPVMVRVSNTTHASGRKYANVSQESADLLWKHTSLFADEVR